MNGKKNKNIAEKRHQQMLEGQYKSLKDAANYESVSSQLPGRENGPADAYRHIIWLGEMARRYKKRFGPFADNIALDAGSWKEISNIVIDNPSKEEVEMDLHNNNIALKIGMEAESYEEVVQKARRIVESSNGKGASNSAKWLPKAKWDKNPQRRKLDAQGNEILNPKTGNPEMEDVPEKDLNWGKFDWVNKVNYKDTHNAQDKNYNAVRKNALKAGEQVEKAFNDLVPKKETPQPLKPEQRGSLLFQEKTATPRDLVFVNETPREIFGMLGQTPAQKPSIRLNKPVRPNAPAAPEDIIKIRTGLEALGQIKRPDYGIVPFVDNRLFDDIKNFQKDNELTIDGVINPRGETETTINQRLGEAL